MPPAGPPRGKEGRTLSGCLPPRPLLCQPAGALIGWPWLRPERSRSNCVCRLSSAFLLKPPCSFRGMTSKLLRSMLSVTPILVHGTYRSRRLETALACLTLLLSALASPLPPPAEEGGSPLPNGATEKTGKGGWGQAASAGRAKGVCCCAAGLDMGSPLPF